jgi:hypothetical protein
MSQHKIER